MLYRIKFTVKSYDFSFWNLSFDCSGIILNWKTGTRVSCPVCGCGLGNRTVSRKGTAVMSEWLLNVKGFPRKNLFPFHVEQIYYCNSAMIPASGRKWNCFEVCLRISSEADSTEDIVDGRLVKMPCPNVVWRLPGSVWAGSRASVRDVISFGYSPEVLKTM